MNRAPWAAATAVMCVALAPPAAVSAAAKRRKTGPRARACETNITVSVLNEQGLAVAGLRPANFRARAGGVVLPVQSVQQGGPGTRILLLLDESASMAGEEDEPGGFVNKLTRDFVGRVWDEHHIAFVSFGSHIYAHSDFSVTPEAILRLLAPPVDPHLPLAHGSSAIWDALSYSAGLFAKPEPGDAIFLITDGKQDISKESPHQVSDELVRKGIRFFLFLTITPAAGSHVATAEAAHSLEAFFALASLTGAGEPVFPFASGEILSVRRPERYAESTWDAFWKYRRFSMLRPVLDSLYSRMTDYYEVRLIRSSGSARKTKLKLGIVNAQGKRLRALEVDYPHQLAACSGTKNN